MTTDSNWDENDSNWDEKYLESLGYPSALHKACMDPFEYEIKLCTGDVFRFLEACPINREWVHIIGTHPRGMDVRVSSIVYVIDAPDGS